MNNFFKPKNNQVQDQSTSGIDTLAKISSDENDDFAILDSDKDKKVSTGKKLKINRQQNQPEQTDLEQSLMPDSEDPSVKLNMNEEGFKDDVFGFSFEMKGPKELNIERIEKFGKSLEEMLNEVAKNEAEDLASISKNIDDYYIEQAIVDLKLVYKRIRGFCIFTATTYKSILNQMIRKIEKIIASDDNFYKRDISNRTELIKQEISSKLPSIIMRDFSTFLASENENPFGLYDTIFKNIKGQDFILTANFLNIQYDNNNFFYVDIPEYLVEINNMLITHLCTIYSYAKKLKFGPKNAMIDIEDQGFRFNFEHQSIVSTGYPVIFARKNVLGVVRLIDNPNYYKDLLSEYEKSPEEKEEIINKMRKMADEGNFLVIGRTGSGKTTLLRQLLLDREQREQNLITIEDTKELNLPNAIAYLTNKDNSISSIFKSTLRMNPSRVVIGETRDKTILDILEVCLTSKSATTLHATDMAKAITRIRMMTRESISTEDLDFLIVSAIDMFIFINNRKITGLYIKNKTDYTGSDIFKAYERLL